MPIDKPNLLRVFASQAAPSERVDPDDSTPGKFENGYRIEVLKHEEFNFVLHQLSEALGHLNERGMLAYDDLTTYEPGARVLASDTVIYKCTATTTGNAPPNATYWAATQG